MKPDKYPYDYKLDPAWSNALNMKVNLPRTHGKTEVAKGIQNYLDMYQKLRYRDQAPKPMTIPDFARNRNDGPDMGIVRALLRGEPVVEEDDRWTYEVLDADDGSGEIIVECHRYMGPTYQYTEEDDAVTSQA